MEMALRSDTAKFKKDKFDFNILELIDLVVPGLSKREIGKRFPELALLGIEGEAKSSVQTRKSQEEKVARLFELAFDAQLVFFKKQERDENGIFYTPPDQIRNSLQKIARRSDSSVCEPACGSGLLLLTYLNEVVKNNHDLPIVRAFDNSDRAVNLTKLFSRLLLAIYFKDFEDLFSKKIEIRKSDVFDMPFSDLKFDVILMNPPYVKGFRKPKGGIPKELLKYGSGNLTNIFLAYADFLSNPKKGRNFLILGEPVKWGNSYSEFVSDVINNRKIIGFSPYLRNFDSISYEVFSITTELGEKGEQTELLNLCGKVKTFSLNVSDIDLTILKKVLSKGMPFSDVIDKCTRGVYVPKSLVKDSGTNFLKSGSEMNCYFYEVASGVSKGSGTWKPIFDTERLIVKAKRGKLLHAAIAPAALGTTDNIVNIKTRHLSQNATVAILNSAFASYFLTNIIFCGNSESARILDGVYLEKLYFPVLNDLKLKHLENLSKIIQKSVQKSISEGSEIWHAEVRRDRSKISGATYESEMNIALREIDEVIFKAFGLSKDEQDYIYENYGRVLTTKKNRKLKAA